MALVRVRRATSPVTVQVAAPLRAAVEALETRSFQGDSPGSPPPLPQPEGSDTAAGASTVSSSASPLVVLAAAGWVALYWVIVVVLQIGGLRPAEAAVMAAGMNVFALLYVATQGTERLLEPLMSLDWTKPKKVIARDVAVAQAASSGHPPDLRAAADKQAELERWRANRTMVAWALATTLGMIASSATGIYLLQMVVTSPQEPRALDILLTGLVVGGGSKPLHDLITRVQSSKDRAKDPAEVA